MKRDAPTVSKEPAPPSAGSSLTDMSTPSRSRRVFLYSRRFRRRIVICPCASPIVLRAVTSVPESISRKSAFATGAGCLESSGGISPELTWLRIFCQRSASWTVSSFRAMSSRRSFPFCLSALWHSTQYSLRKARCFSSIRASGAAPKVSVARRGRRRRRRRGMSDHRRLRPERAEASPSLRRVESKPFVYFQVSRTTRSHSSAISWWPR